MLSNLNFLLEGYNAIEYTDNLNKPACVMMFIKNNIKYNRINFDLEGSCEEFLSS